MKLLVTYFSRTDTTGAVAALAAETLSAAGHQVTVQRLRPLVDLPYLAWLALSAVPGARFPIAPTPADPRQHQGQVLAFPKWTLACPPVNAFLAGQRGRLPPTALLVTCGGWDQDRYLAAYRLRVERLGTKVTTAAWVKKREVGTPEGDRKIVAALDRAFPTPDG